MDRIIKKIKSIFFTCYLCGESSTDEICTQCQFLLRKWEGCFFCQEKCLCSFFSIALWEYNSFSADLILKFKYYDEIFLANFFAKLLYLKIQNLLRKFSIRKENILVVPVPTSRKRLFKRGYNQAVLLGKNIASLLKAEIDPFILTKNKSSIQKGADFSTRILNAENIKLQYIPRDYRTIIIVDDLVASGATIMRCETLLKNRCENMILCAICRTL